LIRPPPRPGVGRLPSWLRLWAPAATFERLRRERSTIFALLALGLLAWLGLGGAATGSPRARTADYCSGSGFSAHRDPSNPLALPKSPGSNPLHGAHFFVPGPRHGMAAGGILGLLHVDPSNYPQNESLETFRRDLDNGPLSRQIQGHPLLAYNVHLLEKIAAEPEAPRFSSYSGGGGPGAIFSQVQNYFCGEASADPGSVPLITTYFLYDNGYSPSAAQIRADMPTFKRRIDELAAATGRHPAVFFLELDAIGSSAGLAASGVLPLWEQKIRYEVQRIGALPHAVVYVEGGYSDANSADYTARALNAVGVRHIRGFFTNDTHRAWTIDEVRWANEVSKLTHGAHFVVNTASNGRGPKLNPGGIGGIEALCNPPGRGIGPRPTANTGFRSADAFVWTGTPGRSAGSCHPGDPPPGIFGVNLALDLSRRANQQLGPGYPNRPY
jgi:endoglucanase